VLFAPVGTEVRNRPETARDPVTFVAFAQIPHLLSGFEHGETLIFCNSGAPGVCPYSLANYSLGLPQLQAGLMQPMISEQAFGADGE